MLPLLSVAAGWAAPPPAEVGPAVGVVVDGALDEPAWAAATPITEFLQYTPVEGGAPTGTTEVRFLQDGRALYVGIRVAHTGYPIRARISSRERINADDQVGIYLDTFHDGRSGYIFYFNPLGVQQDIRHNAGSWNANWDTAYRSAGRVVGDGYEIEVAFPWRSLKFPPVEDGAQTWGLIVTRKVPHLGTKYAWPDITRNRPLLFSEEGELRGVRPPRRGSGLELIPSLTASQVWSGEAQERRPFDALDLSPWTDALRPSLDLRLGITPDLGLAGTLNPDFSQVESDLADVRLNARFAFQFTERRPFFLDGIDLFQDGGSTLYSRSINEPIYGLKLSGREGPLSVGLLHALDQSPLPSVHEEETVGFEPEDVADRWASNTLARLRLDAFGGGWIGMIAADKRLLGTRAAPGAAGANDNVGVDLGVPIGDRWIARAQGQASFLAAPGEALRQGVMTTGSIERNSGLGSGMGLWGAFRSEDFRQEMGFLNQSGNWATSAWYNYTFEGSGLVSTWQPNTWVDVFRENDGDGYTALGLSQDLLLAGVHRINTWGRVDRRVQTGETVDGGGVGASYSGQIGALIELSPSVALQRALDFGTLGPASTLTAGGTITLRTAGFRWDTDVSWSRHVPEGLAPELAHRVRTTLWWQWTRALGARLLVQESRRNQAEGIAQELLVSPLLTFLEVPGTAAYLGWTERLDLLTGETAERVVFAKASVLLRP